MRAYNAIIFYLHSSIVVSRTSYVRCKARKKSNERSKKKRLLFGIFVCYGFGLGFGRGRENLGDKIFPAIQS